MKKKILLFALIFSSFTHLSFGQMKVVIMGSSTAYGIGASTYANSWAGLTENYLNQNMTDGQDTLVYNIARPGYDTYQEMPTGYTPPPGRPLPDDSFNVTRALSFTPDIVIINLPSNDVNYGYAKSETMSNFRVMFSTISASGARCYITTPQPRNDLSADLRDTLFSLVDSVTNAFGPYAINFWDALVTNDGQYSLRDEYRAIPSPLHLNDAGHNVLFEIIRDSYIFGFGTVALQVTSFQAHVQNNGVVVNWHTEQQAPNTTFEVQRSGNGIDFEVASAQTITESRQSANYSITDQRPLPGASFYRLKVTEGGRQFYTGIVRVSFDGKLLSIGTFYNNRNNLTAGISINKSQLVYMTILNTSGAVLLRQSEYINQPLSTINIPIEKLAGGQYYLHVVAAEGNNITRPFTK